MHTIAIIGGGASGMAAALAARESLDNRVVLLERQNRVGRKLLATGNGRCNLSNLHAGPPHYHGGDAGFTDAALARFPVRETLDWFESLGLSARAEASGRLYPLSDAAGSVVDSLRLAMEARGVETRCGFDAAAALRDGDRFLVTAHDGTEVQCQRLIVACGGIAGAKLGGTKAGYELLAGFGHRRTALRPSLVQLKTENTWTRSMKGVRTQAELTLERRADVLARASGEVQFTDYGVTGPAVFDLSRAASRDGEGAAVVLRLLPEKDEDELWDYILRKRDQFPGYAAEHLFTGLLHNALSRTVIRRAGIPLDAKLWSLSEAQLRAAADLILRFELPLLGTLGFEDAQVTAGGVETVGFDPETLESRLVPGLYACGEVLDIDGDCGGFNLQWAWSSGRTAGRAAAAGL